MKNEIAKICGRKAWIVRPVHQRTIQVNAKPRVYVEGLTKRDGSFIRFKSVQRAERHIRNMGLDKKDNG